MKKGKKILIGVTGALVAGIAGITIGEKISKMIGFNKQRVLYGPPSQTMEVQVFDSDFILYVDTSVSASQVKALMSLIKSSNAANGFTTAPDDLNTDKYVYLNATVENAITLPEQVEKNKTYTVEITRYTQGGYVNEITITENETDEPINNQTQALYGIPKNIQEQ